MNKKTIILIIAIAVIGTIIAGLFVAFIGIPQYRNYIDRDNINSRNEIIKEFDITIDKLNQVTTCEELKATIQDHEERTAIYDDLILKNESLNKMFGTGIKTAEKTKELCLDKDS